jgi:hypothetical protein
LKIENKMRFWYRIWICIVWKWDSGSPPEIAVSLFERLNDMLWNGITFTDEERNCPRVSRAFSVILVFVRPFSSFRAKKSTCASRCEKVNT